MVSTRGRLAAVADGAEVLTAMPASSRAAHAGTSKTEQADRAPLSRERVLAAAVDLVDAEGLESLTMRRLGQRLGRDPMALYRYASKKTTLIDGIVEAVMAELPARTGSGDWRAHLRQTAHDFRRLALRHPHVVPLLVTRPLSTPIGLRPPGTLRLLEQLLDLLIRAGFSPVGALHAARAYIGFLYGHVLTELQELVADPEETDDLLRLGLHRLRAAEFPRLRAVAPALLAYDGAAELDEGLDILLAGLQANLAGTENG